ncbi:MAG: hypothetical protein AB7I08_02285 [Thermoleophilia bacterium]
MLTLQRRRRVAAAEIDLYGGTAAAVRLTSRGSRWPPWEASDRLAMPVALAALTLNATNRGLTPRVRHRLMALGAALVEDPVPGDPGAGWADAVAMRDMVPPRGPGQPRINVQLVSTREGPFAVLDGPTPSALTMASACATLAAAALDGMHRDVRLAAALSIEGLLVCQGPPRRTADSAPVAAGAGLRYAAERLEDAGRSVPHALLSATRGAPPTS